MIPGEYSIEISQGDTYYLPLVTISSLATYGGPANLNAPATVTATVYSGGRDFAMSVTYVDRPAGEISLQIPAATTAQIPKALNGTASWDLEVEYLGWVGTVLTGAVTVYPEVPGT
jgi:hypothetical protein